MKMRTIILLSISLFLICCTKTDKPWIGTYALELTAENKEMYDMFQEMEMLWPEITLNKDGTFTLLRTEGGAKIHGTFEVKDNTLTITASDIDGKRPRGKYGTPYSSDFKENFEVLMFEGAGKERWVKKEVNAVFLEEK